MNRPPIFAVAFGWLGGSRLISLTGEVDLNSTSTLDEAVSIIPPFQTAYVDCSDVEFMDSRGLEALIAMNERLRRRHSALQLIELSEPTARIIRLCRINTALRPRTCDPHDDLGDHATVASRTSYSTHTPVRGRSHRHPL
jgi:anti-anti-sigma factor